MIRIVKSVFSMLFIFATVVVVAYGIMWLSGYSLPVFQDYYSNDNDTELVISDAVPANYVIPGGQSIGVKLDVEDVLVVGLEEIETEGGDKVNPGLKAGLQIGDVIIAIDGTEVHNAGDVHNIIEETEQESVRLKIGRKGELRYIDIVPVKSASDGVYRLGLWVKEKTAGIGTLTFYSPSQGTFAALGHGITDAETGAVLKVAEGQLLDARILSLKEGRKGTPGELCGIFYEADEPLGRLSLNTDKGIFGVAYKKLTNNLYSDPVEILAKDDIKEGRACILTTIDGDEVQKFDVRIEKIDIDNEENKNIVIKVTDEKLLNESGGIIQGMSGSPIMQDGKLAGAVTHVLVNNPQKGYGIFIETMLHTAKLAE